MDAKEKKSKQNVRSLKRSAREIESKEKLLKETPTVRSKDYDSFMARNKAGINQIENENLFSDYKIDTFATKRNLKLEAKVKACLSNILSSDADLTGEKKKENINVNTKQKEINEQKLKPCIKNTNYSPFSQEDYTTTSDLPTTTNFTHVFLNMQTPNNLTTTKLPDGSISKMSTTPVESKSKTSSFLTVQDCSNQSSKKEVKNKNNNIFVRNNFYIDRCKRTPHKKSFDTTTNDFKVIRNLKKSLKQNAIATNTSQAPSNSQYENAVPNKPYNEKNDPTKSTDGKRVWPEIKSVDTTINYCFIHPEFQPYIKEKLVVNKKFPVLRQDNSTQTGLNYQIKNTSYMSNEGIADRNYGNIFKSRSEEQNSKEKTIFINSFNAFAKNSGRDTNNMHNELKPQFYKFPQKIEELRNQNQYELQKQYLNKTGENKSEVGFKLNSVHNELNPQFYKFPQKIEELRNLNQNELQKQYLNKTGEIKSEVGGFKLNSAIKDYQKKNRIMKTRSNYRQKPLEKDEKNTPPRKDEKDEQIKNSTPNETELSNNIITSNDNAQLNRRSNITSNNKQPPEEKENITENLKGQKDEDGNVAININLPVGQTYKINAPNLFSVIISDSQANQKENRYKPSWRKRLDVVDNESSSTLCSSKDTSNDSEIGYRRHERPNRIIIGPKQKHKRQFRDHQIQEYNRYLKSMMDEHEEDPESNTKIQEQNERLKRLDKQFKKTRDLHLSDEYLIENKLGSNAFVKTNIIEDDIFDEDGNILIKPQKKQTDKQNIPNVCFELYDNKYVPWTIVRNKSEDEPSNVDTSNKNTTKQKSLKLDKNYKNILNKNLDTEQSVKNLRNRKRETRINEAKRQNSVKSKGKNLLHQNRTVSKENKNVQQQHDDKQSFFNDKTKLIDQAESDDSSSGSMTPIQEPEVLFCTNNKNVISNLVDHDENLNKSKTVVVYSQVTRKPSNEEACFKGLRYHETKISETTRVSVSSKKKKGFINWLKKFFS